MKKPVLPARVRKMVDAIIKEFNSVPRAGKEKTPCKRCWGLHGCAIKSKRKKNVECGAFFDKHTPITITFKDEPEPLVLRHKD